MSGPTQQWVKMGDSTTYFLNNQLQYDSSQAAVLARWVDGNTVLSTRKYKTIYVLQAIENWNPQDTINGACRFFGNVVGGNTTNNQWAGFQTDNVNSFLVELPYNVYGNVGEATALVTNLGVAGSFSNMNFEYREHGNINVDSTLFFGNTGYGNLVAAGCFTPVFNGVNVLATNIFNDGNVIVSNGSHEWNRLLNANLGNTSALSSGLVPGFNNNDDSSVGNFITLVNASCDPCGADGLPIATPGSELTVAGNEFTNEAHRLQVAVKANTTNLLTSIENPTYVVRVDRFGKNVTMNNVNGNLFADEFTSHFFANINGYDNSIYGVNSNLLTSISVSGSYGVPQANVFNSNFLANPSVMNLTANTVDITNNNTFTDSFRLERNPSAVIVDLTANVITNAGDNAPLTSGDSIVMVQANLFAPQGNTRFLGDSTGVVLANIQNAPGNVINATVNGNPQTFTVLNGIEANVFVPNLAYSGCLDAKVMSIFGSDILVNSWTSDPVADPSLVPNLLGTANVNVEYGNIQLYYYPGNVQYTNINSGSVDTIFNTDNYVKSVNTYLNSLSTPNGVLFAEGNVYGVGANVSFDGNLKSRTYGNTLALNLDSIGNVNTPYGCNMDFYFFGNALLNSDRLNVDQPNVIGGNTLSYVSNAFIKSTFWANVLFNGETTGPTQSNLKLDGNSTQTPLYQLVFDNYIGNVIFSSGLLNTNVAYAPNLVLSGNYLEYKANVLSGNIFNGGYLQSLNLDNNNSLGNIYKNGVAYSKHTFASDVSDTWTDIGNICGLDSSNFTYSTYLPQYGNANLSSSNPYTIVSDTFINTILTFTSGFDPISMAGNVFKFVVADTQFKSYVSSVTDYQGLQLANDMTLFGNTVFNPATLNPIGNVFQNATYTSDMIGNLRSAPFVSYTYTNMTDSSAREQCYPFYNVNDVDGRTAGNVLYDDNYLFPGFIYKKPTPTTTEFFNYRASVDCDFEIKANVAGSANDLTQQFRLYAIDTVNKTIKVALNTDPVTKVIPLRPIRWGRRYLTSSSSAADWYTYITVKLTGVSNTNGKDYSVVFIRLKSDDLAPNAVPNDLDPATKLSLPLTINVAPVENWEVNKVNFKAYLSVYSNTGVLNTNFTTTNGAYWQFNNIDIGNDFTNGSYSFSNPPTLNATPSNPDLNVKLFSQPLNNSFMTYQFLGSTVKRLLRYNYEEYDVNDNLIPSSVNTNLFATSLSTGGAPPALNVDTNLPSNLNIQPNSTRFYLDGTTRSIFVDIPQNDILTTSLIGQYLIVGRSLRYTLSSDLPSPNNVKGLLNYLHTGSITDGSGFNLVFNNENTGNLSSRFVLNAQSVSLAPYVTSGFPTFNYQTKTDRLVIFAVSHNPKDDRLLYVENMKLHNLSNNVVSLSALFGGVLPSVSFSSIRGFRLNNANFNAIGSPLFVLPTTTPYNSAVFRVRVLPDRYIMYAPDVTLGPTLYNSVFINTNNTFNVSPPSPLASSLYTNVQMAVTDAGDLSLSPKATLDWNTVEYWLNNATSSNQGLLLATYVNSGYGTVQLLYEDFIGCYDILLDEYQVNASPRTTLNQNLRHTLGTSVTGSVQIKKYNGSFPAPADLPGGYSFYIEYTLPGDIQRTLFLKGSDVQWLSGKVVPLVYTGARPLVLHRVSVSSGSPITMSSVVSDMYKFSNYTQAIFGGVSPSISGVVSAHSYSVVLTNSNLGYFYMNPGSATNFVLYRGLRLAHSTLVSAYTGPYPSHLFGWFGSYVSANSALNNVTVSYTTTSGSGSFGPLQTSFVYNGQGYTNNSDKNILNGDTTVYAKYQVTSGSVKLFKILAPFSTNDSPNFTLTFGAAKATLYPAYDYNGDDVIGQTVVGSTTISELLYNLNNSGSGNPLVNMSPLLSNPSIQSTGNEHLKYIVDLNNSTVFTDGWVNLPNTYLDIKFNKKFSVGYALDNFFILKAKGSAEFNVYEINTAQKTNPYSDQATELVLTQREKLFIPAPNAWARHGANANDLSGLTFKLAQGKSVVNNEVVNLFCANVPTENYYKWSVTNTLNGLSSTPYEMSISVYDEDTYARLLNEQLNVDQELSPNA